MPYLDKRSCNTADELKQCVDALNAEHGEHNIYVMKRNNNNGTYTVYAYEKAGLYTPRPQQPRNPYKKRTVTTTRPKGTYKKKIRTEDVIRILRDVIGESETLQKIISKL